MNHSVIDEYIRTGMPDVLQATRDNRRSRLRSLAVAVNPGPDAPPKPPTSGHNSVKPPYSPTEAAQIVSIATTQPTERLRASMMACVGLGLGAGFDSCDLRESLSKHVRRHSFGLTAEVIGPRARTTGVIAEFAPLVIAGIEGLKADELIIGKDVARRNLAAKVYENAIVLGPGPKIEQGRLRSTFIASLLTASLPLPVVMKAAGLKTARTLIEIAAYIDLDEDAIPEMVATCSSPVRSVATSASISTVSSEPAPCGYEGEMK